MKQKRCTKCNVVKDISDFGRQASRPDGIHIWCKRCNVIYATAYQKAHPETKEKNRINSKLYRETHKKEISEKRKAKDDANREQKRERDRKYAAAHRQEAIKRARAWYIANKERMAKWSKDYREKNSEKIKISKAEYSRTHKIERNALEHKREAKKKGNGGTYTKQQFIDLCQKYDNKCLMCGRSDVKLTVDHVVPISLGGSNYIDNIQPLCLSCNSKKHTSILDLR